MSDTQCQVPVRNGNGLCIVAVLEQVSEQNVEQSVNAEHNSGIMIISTNKHFK